MSKNKKKVGLTEKTKERNVILRLIKFTLKLIINDKIDYEDIGNLL